MKKLPIDVSTFKILINKKYQYVDKTEHIYNLITTGRFYFLSRPRRFGKSLLISTLKELFSGNKGLFQDLWITKNTTYEWVKYPVIHLDFSRLAIGNSNELKISISEFLEEIAQDYGIDISGATFFGLKLARLIKELAVKAPVAVLIDEYDYPIINNLAKPEIAEENRDVLKDFSAR